MLRKHLFFGFGFQPVYGPEGSDGAATGTQTEGGGAAAATGATTTTNQTPPATNPADENDPFKKLKFTQEQQEFFNRRMAEERKQLQTQNNKTIEELKKLQTAQGTTEQQKKELQERINDLQRQYMSKEELARQEQEKREKEYQSQVQTYKTEAETWKTRFHETTITRALQDGAIEFEAFNPGQIVDLLQNKTKLIEEKDTDGNSTGRLIPRVALMEYDNEGKPVPLDLTVKEALTRMKNTSDRFGNLFKATLASGLGQSGNGAAGGKKGKIDPAKMTPQEWNEYRKKDPNFAGLVK